MASLKDIRRRIGSVKNTQQITKAMKMVAAARLRRAQEAIAGARPFAQKLEELTTRIIVELIQNNQIADPEKQAAFLEKLHPLLKAGKGHEGQDGNPVQRVALVVTASDRGLCGAYNTNALRFAHKRYLELIQNPATQVSLFFVGRRANDYFSRRGLKGHWFSEFWAGRYTTAKSNQLADYFTERFLSGEFDSVEICHTQFKSAIAQFVATKVVLPLSLGDDTKAAVDHAEATVILPFIYKPSREEILAELLPKQVRTQFYKIFADSLASEFGARMTSMDNATRNAGDMIQDLTLQANRLRQAGITKELMEIVSGAEAIKG